MSGIKHAGDTMTDAACLVGGIRVRFRWPGRDMAALDALTRDYDKASPSLDAWTVMVGTDGHFEVRSEHSSQEILVRTRPSVGFGAAIQEALLSMLLKAERLPVHAALITKSPALPGTLLVGDSGHGKSSLVFLAINRGWHVVSDDLVALRTIEPGEVSGAAIRRQIRVSTGLVTDQTRRRGRKIRREDGVEKILFDPNVLYPGSFLPEARIGSVLFLKRGASRSFANLSALDTFDRLMWTAGRTLVSSRSRVPFETLSVLARTAPARVARLTQSCLTDPDVLQELAA